MTNAPVSPSRRSRAAGLEVVAALLFFGTSHLSPALAGEVRVPVDQPTIESALAAASSGDTVLVAEGTHACAALRVPDGVTLRAAVRDGKAVERTILDFGGRDEAPGITLGDGSFLSGLTVTGVGRFDEARWKTEFDRGGEGQSREHLGGGTPAVAIDGVSARIEGCRIRENGGSGIRIRGTADDGQGNVASFHAVVTRNQCERNMGAGISVIDTPSALISDNICRTNFFAGIGHRNASPFVVGNRCLDNVRAGIGISEGSSPLVRGNECIGNGRAGIGIRTGESTAPVVEHNVCRDNAMAGIGCREGARPILRDNRCERNRAAGIGARDGGSPIVVGNICRENEAAGIGVAGQGSAVLVENTCADNRLVAIGLPDGARAVIAGNTLSRSGGMPPLVAIKGGSSAVLAGNVLTGGGVAGVLVEGRAVIGGNRIAADEAAPSSNGIWIWKDSEAVLGGNQIDGFRNAVSTADGAAVIGDHQASGQ